MQPRKTSIAGIAGVTVLVAIAGGVVIQGGGSSLQAEDQRDYEPLPLDDKFVKSSAKFQIEVPSLKKRGLTDIRTSNGVYEVVLQSRYLRKKVYEFPGMYRYFVSITKDGRDKEAPPVEVASYKYEPMYVAPGTQESVVDTISFRVPAHAPEVKHYSLMIGVEEGNYLSPDTIGNLEPDEWLLTSCRSFNVTF
jgi:hypothetical protein